MGKHMKNIVFLRCKDGCMDSELWQCSSLDDQPIAFCWGRLHPNVSMKNAKLPPSKAGPPNHGTFSGPQKSDKSVGFFSQP